jgi:hypothetical protein
MTQRRARQFLVVFFLITFGAVFLRVDYFPLSWVPMYGRRDTAAEKTYYIGDLERRTAGLEAQRANGERLFVNRKLLNIPQANFRRLYMQRAFNSGPPQHVRERLALMPFNRWWYETLVGPDPLLGANYPAQLLRSINATLGHGADDPRRVVRLEAHVDLATFSRASLNAGDLSIPQVRHATAQVTETETILTFDGMAQRIAGPGIDRPPLYVDN